MNSPSIRRASTRLADGRELIYFDDDPDAGDRAGIADLRLLGEPATSGTMRLDHLTGEWVAMASHRQNRTFLPPADECPLCPTGRGSVPSEVPAAEYDVVVFENRFPSSSGRATDPAPAADPMLASRPAQGRCEVVCFTSDHDAGFASLSSKRVRTVIEAWVDRTTELSQLDGVEYVFCFENRGQEIGVTLHHPLGQIYAYPYVPARTQMMLDQAMAHKATTGRLLGSDLLESEQGDRSRVVMSSDHWTVYAPFASRWPVEVHLAPHRDVPDLASLKDAERADLAEVYPELLRRLDRYYVNDDGSPVAMPYIAGWHQAPVRQGRDAWRLNLQLTSVLRAPGRLKYLAG